MATTPVQVETKNTGRARFRPVGEWSPDGIYAYFDLVTRQGSSYFCKNWEGITSPTPPEDDPTNWQMNASKGDKGDGLQSGGEVGGNLTFPAEPGKEGIVKGSKINVFSEIVRWVKDAMTTANGPCIGYSTGHKGICINPEYTDNNLEDVNTGLFVGDNGRLRYYNKDVAVAGQDLNGNLNVLGTLSQNGLSVLDIVDAGGSKETGYYVKYSNGTMIEYGIADVAGLVFDSVTGNIFTSTGNPSITYPVAFFDKPSFSISGLSTYWLDGFEYGYQWGTASRYSTEKAPSVVFLSSVKITKPLPSMKTAWMAIGRWQ